MAKLLDALSPLGKIARFVTRKMEVMYTFHNVCNFFAEAIDFHINHRITYINTRNTSNQCTRVKMAMCKSLADEYCKNAFENAENEICKEC